ncbi:MAG: RDD family protein [Bryobacteraceae bacterium]
MTGSPLPAFQEGAAAYALEPVAAAEAPDVQHRPADFRNARQQGLFEETYKIIEFPAPRRPAPKPAAEGRRNKRSARPKADAQPYLDFSPPQPNTPKTLGTSVEASIYCDYNAASPMHRAVASVIDTGVIVIALAAFGATFALAGGTVVWDTVTVALLAGSVVLVGVFYGLVWALAGGETLGRQKTGLRIVNLDGLPVDWRQRLGRLACATVSVFAGTVGLLWSLFDEESLAWHDHMSRSFPTAGE